MTASIIQLLVCKRVPSDKAIFIAWQNIPGRRRRLANWSPNREAGARWFQIGISL